MCHVDAAKNWGAIPRERDLAAAIAQVSDEWFEEFLKALFSLSVNRAMAVARCVESIGMESKPASLGDFGTDPSDSEHLQELRETIESYLGWKNDEDKERGDHALRIREIGDALWNCEQAILVHHDKELASQILLSVMRRPLVTESTKNHFASEEPAPPRESLQQELDAIDHVLETHGLDSTRAVRSLSAALHRLKRVEDELAELEPLKAEVEKLSKKVQAQRVELRRFNRDARVRAEGFREAFRHGASTAARTLHDYLAKQSPHWATERAVNGVQEFLGAWIEHEEEARARASGEAAK